jgi:hypothetical protein
MALASVASSVASVALAPAQSQPDLVRVRGLGHALNAGYVRTVLRVPSWVLRRGQQPQDLDPDPEGDWYIEDDYWPDQWCRRGSCIEDDYMSSVRVRKGFSDQVFEVPPQQEEDEQQPEGVVSGQGWRVVRGRDLVAMDAVLTLDRLKLLGLLNRVLRFLQRDLRKLEVYDRTGGEALQRTLVEKRVVLRWTSALKARDPQGRRLNRQRRAARTIQRAFREANTNPAFRMCRNRLQREFEEFLESSYY